MFWSSPPITKLKNEFLRHAEEQVSNSHNLNMCWSLTTVTKNWYKEQKVTILPHTRVYKSKCIRVRMTDTRKSWFLSQIGWTEFKICIPPPCTHMIELFHYTSLWKESIYKEQKSLLFKQCEIDVTSHFKAWVWIFKIKSLMAFVWIYITMA